MDDYSYEDIKVSIITGLTIAEAITDPIDNVFWFALTKASESLQQLSANAFLREEHTALEEMNEKFKLLQNIHTDLAANALLPGFRLSDSHKEVIAEVAAYVRARTLEAMTAALKATGTDIEDLFFPLDGDRDDFDS